MASDSAVGPVAGSRRRRIATFKALVEDKMKGDPGCPGARELLDVRIRELHGRWPDWLLKAVGHSGSGPAQHREKERHVGRRLVLASSATTAQRRRDGLPRESDSNGRRAARRLRYTQAWWRDTRPPLIEELRRPQIAVPDGRPSRTGGSSSRRRRCTHTSDEQWDSASNNNNKRVPRAQWTAVHAGPGGRKKRALDLSCVRAALSSLCPPSPPVLCPASQPLPAHALGLRSSIHSLFVPSTRRDTLPRTTTTTARVRLPSAAPAKEAAAAHRCPPLPTAAHRRERRLRPCYDRLTSSPPLPAVPAASHHVARALTSPEPLFFCFMSTR
ncbi:hypothetical protein P154DRAFT_571468 [Amniculicola lignicola CBS 123094]|uniref:Uncharacterized protein n=1 Tax=Amniculicola lignicola CBS 123094 TaxID=1392246 RepID=A0A6A5WYL5_9PLEO|nr:hypothetical protein P154DRAFT_571468 [Amniculicola lignicola CBS 123094]